jgi:hypothetical protein
MNERQPERQNVTPDYLRFHDIEVSEVHEVHQGFSLLKCIVEFIANSHIPGIVAVGTLFVLSRIGCAVAESKELTNNGLLGALAIALMAFIFGGIGLYLDWKHHATNSQKLPNIPSESRNGRVGTAETGSAP